MKTPTYEDWIYVAGIIDGEGSIGLAKVKNTNRVGKKYFVYCPFVCVGNTNKVLTDWLHETFEGKLKFSKRTGKNKDFWFWDMRGRDQIKWFLSNVQNHLKLKKQQAILLQAYFDRWHVTDTEWRESFHEELTRLNRRGKPVEANTPDIPENGMKIESELYGDIQRAPVVTLETAA